MRGIKAISLLTLLLLFRSTSEAQLHTQPLNLGRYDRQPIHFGFSLGINSANFRVNLADDLMNRDSIYRIDPDPVTGLNLGIISNLRIGEHFDLRFIPALSFCQRGLVYDFVYPTGGSATVVKQVESTYLEFPVLLKFKSKRVNNYRVYVLGGGRYSIDMVSQAKVKQKDKDIVKLSRNDYGYEIGLGFDFYLEYFKFSPEIKMFQGLPNLLVRENTPYSSPIDALNSKIFFLTFNFE